MTLYGCIRFTNMCKPSDYSPKENEWVRPTFKMDWLEMILHGYEKPNKSVKPQEPENEVNFDKELIRRCFKTLVKEHGIEDTIEFMRSCQLPRKGPREHIKRYKMTDEDIEKMRSKKSD